MVPLLGCRKRTDRREPRRCFRATKELPDDTSEPSRQYWDPEDVQALLDHVTKRIDEQLEEGGITGAFGALRDLSLVSILAFTGVHGAEVLRDFDDDRPGQQGLRWSHVDLDSGKLTVLGKSQEWEHGQLPAQAEDHLHRHRLAQRPATDD